MLEGQASLYILFSIGSGVVCLCFMICLYCCYSSIALAINVVDASADFVMCTKRILFIPLFYFILSMVIVGVWFTGYMMVMSINPISAVKIIPYAQLR
jgi:hypothetical protein